MANNPMHLGLILMAAEASPEVAILVRSFSAYGFELTVVPDGETVLTQSLDLKPDMIFLNVILPGLSGFETCLRLKAQEVTEHIPIIFITNPSDTISSVKGFSVGAVDYVTKPIQLDSRDQFKFGGHDTEHE